MINEPTTLLATLELLAKTNAEARRLHDVLEGKWRDYRWTVLAVRSDGDLSDRRWRHAYAFDLAKSGYAWGASEFAVVYGEFPAGTGATCTSTSGPRHDWPRYAETTRPVPVGDWILKDFYDAEGVKHSMWVNTKYENRAPLASTVGGIPTTFGQIAGALQAAISSAQEFVEGAP